MINLCDACIFLKKCITSSVMMNDDLPDYKEYGITPMIIITECDTYTPFKEVQK